MTILLVEPTGRNSHYHYVRALFDRLVNMGLDLSVLTASDYNHPRYLNQLHRLTERRSFRWPLMGILLRKCDRLLKISANYIRVLKTIRKTQAQIVHFQVLHHLYLPLLWLAKKTLHFQIVYTPHNIGGHYRGKWVFNSVNALFFKLCRRSIDAFIAHTPYHAEKLKSMGIGPEKITIIPYAPHMVGEVDLSHRQRHTILFAGSIRRNKGIERFLEAIEILSLRWAQDHPDRVTVIIAGLSRDLSITAAIDSLKRECANLDIEFQNRFIPADQYSRYFNRASILVLPYTQDFQSLSAVLLDGYHYDNEIIATNAGANGETVRTDGTGTVVEAGDVEAIAHHIQRILREGPDPIHSQNREKALRTIYNWDIIAVKTQDLYKRLKPIKILMIGYLPPPTGGVRVLFRQLTEQLGQEKEVEITVVSLTGKRRGLLWKSASLCYGIMKALYHCLTVDVVSLQPTNQALIAAGPLLHIACRILGKPLIIRKFGGSFHETFSNYPALVRTLLEATVFKANLWLLETHFLVNHFKTKMRRVTHYPNSRPLGANPSPRSSNASSFAFISHISAGKGVEDLFEVSDHLPPACRIDIFGPLGFDITETRLKQLDANHQANYKGMIPPQHVPEVLKTYDVLILPTRLQTEGYPGIILEAYACGVPVIASDCGAIGEIVDATSGILVEPGNQERLQQAILEIHRDQSLFRKLQEGTVAKAKQFDSRFWTAEFLRFCRELHETGNVE